MVYKPKVQVSDNNTNSEKTKEFEIEFTSDGKDTVLTQTTENNSQISSSLMTDVSNGKKDNQSDAMKDD